MGGGRAEARWEGRWGGAWADLGRGRRQRSRRGAETGRSWGVTEKKRSRGRSWDEAGEWAELGEWPK